MTNNHPDRGQAEAPPGAGPLLPFSVSDKVSAAQLVERMGDTAFQARNVGIAAQIWEAMLRDETTIFFGLAGAMVPAGMRPLITYLIENRLIDVIVSTGANLYHDTHFALGMDLHQSRPGLDDRQLREHQVIRIYDIVFDYENLLGTDRFYRTLCRGEAFQKTFGTAEFHHLVGKYLVGRAIQSVTSALRAQAEAAAREEVHQAIVEYCAAKPSGGAGMGSTIVPPVTNVPEPSIMW